MLLPLSSARVLPRAVASSRGSADLRSHRAPGGTREHRDSGAVVEKRLVHPTPPAQKGSDHTVETRHARTHMRCASCVVESFKAAWCASWQMGEPTRAMVGASAGSARIRSVDRSLLALRRPEQSRQSSRSTAYARSAESPIHPVRSETPAPRQAPSISAPACTSVGFPPDSPGERSASDCQGSHHNLPSSPSSRPTL